MSMNPETHQHQDELLMFNDFSNEAEYVERRRAQNRIAQRNYRNNSARKRQAEKNNKERSESQVVPSSTFPSTTSNSGTTPPTTTLSQTAAIHGQMEATSSRYGMAYVTKYQETALPNFDDNAVNDAQLSMELGLVSHQAHYRSSTSDTHIDSLSDDYQMSLTSQVALSPSLAMNISPHNGAGCKSKSQGLDVQSPSLSKSEDSSLLSFPFPATLSTHRGGTALHKAASAGHEEVVRLLLDQGADINALNNYGRTPLHLACETGFINISDVLLARGSNPNIKDNLGWTPLHWAAEYDNPRMVWSLLTQKGVDIDSVDNLGHTALHRAAEGGRYDVVRLLLHQGADPNLQSKNE